MKGIGKTVWNGGYVNIYQSSNRRTSLVPAPAVIPAPKVYSKVAAVKTFVVYLRVCGGLVNAFDKRRASIWVRCEIWCRDQRF